MDKLREYERVGGQRTSSMMVLPGASDICVSEVLSVLLIVLAHTSQIILVFKPSPS